MMDMRMVDLTAEVEMKCDMLDMDEGYTCPAPRDNSNKPINIEKRGGLEVGEKGLWDLVFGLVV